MSVCSQWGFHWRHVLSLQRLSGNVDAVEGTNGELREKVKMKTRTDQSCRKASQVELDRCKDVNIFRSVSYWGTDWTAVLTFTSRCPSDSLTHIVKNNTNITGTETHQDDWLFSQPSTECFILKCIQEVCTVSCSNFNGANRADENEALC